MKPHPLPAQILSALVIAGLLIPPGLLHAADAASTPSASIADTTVNGLNGLTSGLASFNTAFGASGLQMQTLAAQLTNTQNQAMMGNAPQNQFDQLGQQLQLAMLEAQNCVQKATRDYSKYHKNHKTAGDVRADKLTSMEPTCKNHGFIADAISVNKERMLDSNKKMACIVNLQNTVGTLAEKAKQPLNQLTNSAGEVYKTHSQIIDVHRKASCKILADVEGVSCDKDGKPTGEPSGNGYKAKLMNLRNLSRDLNMVIDGAMTEKDGKKFGFAQRVDQLQTMRATYGNEWYFTFMRDVESCFNNNPAPCFDNNESMPPAQCVVAIVGNQADQTAGVRARAKTDSAGIANLAKLNYSSAQKINLPANLDIAKPDAFLGFARKRFDETVSSMVSKFGSHNFALKVDKGKLKDAITQGYNACWDQSAEVFRSDLTSKGLRYYGAITQMKKAEGETSAELTQWIKDTQHSMTEFSTAFHKTYQLELPQFSTDCTADKDPYRQLDCLRVFSATLESGIKGTRQSVRLGDGSQFTSFAGETMIPINTLVTGPDGKPTMGTTNAPCAGFDACMTYLDQSRASHDTAASKGEEDRAKFVDTHNTAVRAAFTTLGNQFGQMGQLITMGVKGITDDLAKIGVKASLKTKSVEGEPLVENEKTGMIDMPKNMKAALAAQSSYMEIEDTKDVTTAYNDLAVELNRKASEAAKMKTKCKVDKKDYEAFANLMPKDCSQTKQICGGNRLAVAGIGMEDVFRRGQETIEDTTRSTANSSYNQCKTSANNDARSVTSAEVNRELRRSNPELAKKKKSDRDGEDDLAIEQAREDAIALRRREAEDRVREECNASIYASLDGLAGKGRNDTLRDQNKKLVQSLRDVNDACTAVEAPVRDVTKKSGTDDAFAPLPDRYAETNDTVTEACEAFKSASKNAAAPTGEDPTVVAEDGKSEQTSNPLLFPGSVAPAK